MTLSRSAPGTTASLPRIASGMPSSALCWSRPTRKLLSPNGFWLSAAYENVVRRCSFVPFGYISRKQVAVGALIKAVECHDVSIQMLGHAKDERDSNSLAASGEVGQAGRPPKGGGCHSSEPSTAPMMRTRTPGKGRSRVGTEWRRHGWTAL
jgi:hypothetical protein